jgi:FkbM family methyltransferase
MYNPDWLRYLKRVVRTGLGTDHLLKPEVRLATRRVGSYYGGWVIAVDALKNREKPVVLSFGLGDDISFDEEISQYCKATVYGFDPTPTSVGWIATHGKPPNMQVFPVGIASFDGQQKFSSLEGDNRGNFSIKQIGSGAVICQVMRYDSILAMLNLSYVDILKLDVEGSEYDVIPDVLNSPILPIQFLIEFHHRLHDIHVRQTRDAVEAIRRGGFSLFSVSPGGQEFSFIRRQRSA